jgi:hypothetical protein
MYLLYKAISVSLWINIDRQFPLVPIFSIPEDLLQNIDLIVNSLSIILILLVALFPRRKIILLLFIIIEISSLTLDQMRWQPLPFQVIIIFIAVYFSPKRSVTFLYAILVATYFYSGLHKLNPGFNNVIWSKILLIDWLSIPTEIAHYKWVKLSGYGIAMMELLLGLSLLTRFHKYAQIGLILMHFFLIVFLINTGINTVVIPWNILMIFYLSYFWLNQSHQSIRYLWKPIAMRLLMILIFIFPILRFVDAYPPFFSFSIYSGNDKHLFLYTDDEKYRSVTNSHFTDYYVIERKYAVSFTEWSFKELNVPVPSYKSLFFDLKEELNLSRDSDVIYTFFPHRQPDCRVLE